MMQLPDPVALPCAHLHPAMQLVAAAKAYLEEGDIAKAQRLMPRHQVAECAILQVGRLAAFCQPCSTRNAQLLFWTTACLTLCPPALLRSAHHRACSSTAPRSCCRRCS